jgi:hypothetical protein
MQVEQGFSNIKNLAKNEDKSWATCVQLIARIDFWSQKPNFGDPVHH